MTKQEIRKKILAKRNNLPKNWVIQKSRLIHRRLIATKEFRKAKTIIFYITKDNEVDTKSTIKLALRKQKIVCAPCTNKINHRLRPAIIRNLEMDLVKGNFGILEPYKKATKPKKIDLIIVPGISFDANGYRLGWGRAYYDRFLEDVGNIPKIGLAFEFQIVKKLPVDNYDIPMDKVITEKKTIKMTKSK